MTLVGQHRDRDLLAREFVHNLDGHLAMDPPPELVRIEQDQEELLQGGHPPSSFWCFVGHHGIVADAPCVYGGPSAGSKCSPK